MLVGDSSRRVALWLSLAAWLYSWYLIRGLRAVYSDEVRDIGAMPPWLLGLMVLTSTILLGASVSAGMRIPIWPLLSVAGGLAIFGLIVLGQFAVMNSVFLRPVSVGQALNEALENRKAWSVALFVAGIPTVLVLAGLTGMIRNRLVAYGGKPQA